MPDRPRPPATPDSLENATRMRVSRSLHGFWRKAVRGPLKSLARPAARRDGRARQGRRSGQGRPDDRARRRSVRGPVPAAAGPVHGGRGDPVPHPPSSPDRQFHDDRGDALCRAYGRRAAPDPRTPRRPILVSEVRAPHLRGRAAMAPFVPRTLSRGVPVVGQGDRRARPGRTGRASRCSSRTASRTRRGSPRRGSSSPIPRSPTMAITCSTSRR